MGLSWGLCYEIQKGLRYEGQSLADSLRKVCWQYWLNFSHAVTFFSVRISDSMKIDSMMRTCTLT